MKKIDQVDKFCYTGDNKLLNMIEAVLEIHAELMEPSKILI